jgi:LysR family transcriptional regulator, glycine cleavage system transcriptional activator
MSKRRLSTLPVTEQLEGFSLLHLTSYLNDSSAIGWPGWTKRHGNRRIAPERGIRYAHLVHALAAVCSNVGTLICGLGLVQTQLVTGKLALPFDASPI